MEDDYSVKALISVVITTYNRPVSILNRALESVLKQTYINTEIIIVNDAPNNKKLIKDIKTLIESKMDHRILYIENSKNIGACESRNRGIHEAHGDFIAFLDDDDEWFPLKLEKQIGLFNDARIGIVYCSNYETNHEKKEKIIRKVIGFDKQFHEILQSNYIGSTSIPLIRKECFEECGMFDKRFLSSQDWDMWIRIIRKHQAVLCRDILVNHILSDDSITGDIGKKKQGWKAIEKKYSRFYLQNQEVYHGYLQYIVRILHKHYRYCFVSLCYEKKLILFNLSFLLKKYTREKSKVHSI